MLAGGVSLGPENPIIGINVGLRWRSACASCPRSTRRCGLAIAVAGTIGAMFGTPVAAALLLSELEPATVGSRCGTGSSPRWSRRPPGADDAQLADLDLSVAVPAYTYAALPDLGYAVGVAVAPRRSAWSRCTCSCRCTGCSCASATRC